MKTAEEWVEIWKADGDGEDTSDHEIGYQLRFAKQIQADALRHAAILCANSDNHLCGIAAIENEANKLETK